MGLFRPPLALNRRGLGELTVALGFGLLIPVGADLVQRGWMHPLPAWAGLGFALMATSLLLSNQFPDLLPDALVATGRLPAATLLVWATLPLTLTAATILWRHYDRPSRLRGALFSGARSGIRAPPWIPHARSAGTCP